MKFDEFDILLVLREDERLAKNAKRVTRDVGDYSQTEPVDGQRVGMMLGALRKNNLVKKLPRSSKNQWIRTRKGTELLREKGLIE